MTYADARYELRVTLEPDEDGHYRCNVYVNGNYGRTFHDHSREAVIAAGHRWVAWRRETSDLEEVIAL